jgi:hypothetical protein
MFFPKPNLAATVSRTVFRLPFSTFGKKPPTNYEKSTDTIKAHATHQEVRFEAIHETDLILHIVLQLRAERFEWFPRTSAYGSRFSKIEFFGRLVSRNHFEKVKVLFDVKTVEEFKALVEQCVARNNADRQNYSSVWEFNIPRVENVIDVQNIAATR